MVVGRCQLVFACLFGFLLGGIIVPGLFTAISFPQLDKSILPVDSKSDGATASRSGPARVFEIPLYWCPHVPNSRERLLQELGGRKPGLIIDGGALDGKDAIAVALKGHRVISIEPTPGRKQSALVARLERSNVSHLIDYHHMALTNFTGTIPFHVIGKSFGSGQDQIDTFDQYNFTHTVEVKADTLDNLIGNQHVLWMKIDTQGHDAVVLRGAQKTLSEGRVDVLTFEVSPGLTPNYHEYVEIVEWLWKVGYTCHDCHSFTDIAEDSKHPETRTAVSMDEFVDKMRNSIGRGRGGVEVARDTDFVCFSSNPRQ